ncbi:MAG: DUF5681 domain-containing protein [Pseudomonadota bacterium]|nr:DUF5681 domain-containing protein [Pseudomonadota bacterium]
MARFKPGQSGNPKGKPVGAKSRYTEMREALADDLPALVERTKAAALEGDMTAMRLLLERTLPPVKAGAAAILLPELEDAATLTDKARAVVSAIGRGDIPPDIGANLMQSLGGLAKLVEVDELTRRVEALEGKANGQAE